MPESAATPLDDAVDAYLERLRTERMLSDHTVDAYRRDLRQLAVFCGRLGLDTVDAIDRTALRRFLAQLSARRYAPRTIGRKASAVRGFLERVKDKGGDVPFGPSFEEDEKFWFGGFADPEGNICWVVEMPASMT